MAPVSCSGTRWWWMAATPCADERLHEDHAERNGIMHALMATAATILLLASASLEANELTVWHTHPLDQILIVTAGVGRGQQWGGPVQEIQPGDVVRIPPGVKHWHGAAPTTTMTHIALTEELDSTNTDWLEKVSDAQYG
jgi:quercetin dioxygenase-like cupin family protein